MTDRPILFSATMIRALLAGRKTQTRRPLYRLTKDIMHAVEDSRYPSSHSINFGPGETFTLTRARDVKVGDRLWVREAFSYDSLDIDHDGTPPPWFWAAGNPEFGDFTKPKPSIHMPRWASRLTLTVTEVRVQRLQEISEEDAIAEGIPPLIAGHFYCGEDDEGEVHSKSPITAYAWLWNSINGQGAWAANPYVAAYTFSVEQRNIDA